MRKIQRAIFFLTPGILMRFLAKKMREYREIAPENDPCCLQGPMFNIYKVQCLLSTRSTV